MNVGRCSGAITPIKVTAPKGKEKRQRKDSDSDSAPAPPLPPPPPLARLTRSTAVNAKVDASLPSAPSSIGSGSYTRTSTRLGIRPGSHVSSLSGKRSASRAPGTENSGSLISIPLSNSPDDISPATTLEVLRETRASQHEIQLNMYNLRFSQVQGEQEQAQRKYMLMVKELESSEQDRKLRRKLEAQRRYDEFLISIAGSPGLDPETHMLVNQKVRLRVLAANAGLMEDDVFETPEIPANYVPADYPGVGAPGLVDNENIPDTVYPLNGPHLQYGRHTLTLRNSTPGPSRPSYVRSTLGTHAPASASSSRVPVNVSSTSRMSTAAGPSARPFGPATPGVEMSFLHQLRFNDHARANSSVDSNSPSSYVHVDAVGAMPATQDDRKVE